MSEAELERYIISFRSTVYRLALSYLKNREDAEDVSQDAFVKLLKCGQVFESDENVKAWLIRVTINLCKNLLKASWRKKRFELIEAAASAPDENDGIGEYISLLKPEYSSVLYLYYYEGYSTKEIAQLTRITDVAARTRLSRARKLLKEMLLKEDAL